MDLRENMHLALPGDLGPECLQDDFRVETHPQESLTLTFWDSFEWRIWYLQLRRSLPIGSCLPGLRAPCHRKGEKTLYVYPLRVTTVLKKWPEMNWGKREVLPVQKTLKMIGDPELTHCIYRLVA